MWISGCGEPIARNTSQMIVRSMKLRAVSGRHAEDAVRQATTQSSLETLAKMQPRSDASEQTSNSISFRSRHVLNFIVKITHQTWHLITLNSEVPSAGRCHGRCIYGVLRCTLWLVNFSHVRWRTHKLELELIIETFIRRNYTWENKGAENSFLFTTPHGPRKFSTPVEQLIYNGLIRILSID